VTLLPIKGHPRPLATMPARWNSCSEVSSASAAPKGRCRASQPHGSPRWRHPWPWQRTQSIVGVDADRNGKLRSRALAQDERERILARCNAGRQVAIAKGVKFGPKPKLTKHQRDEALKRLAAGESCRAIAKTFDVHHATIARLTG
jgi:Helix-turn-helix domain